MKSLLTFIQKEYIETIRTGKLMIILLLFVLFAIMSPAVAKLTPWIMELLSESMAENGLIITNIQVNAFTSWTQFFKNIPIALIAFVLIFSDTFTKEYNSGTLLLVLTKGLSRYKVVIAKSILLLSIWTVGYWICFTITYGYNAYFWDNSIMLNLFFSATMWWIFGMWIISLITLFSSLLNNNTGVSLCIAGTVLFAYLLNIFPKTKWYSPTALINIHSLLIGAIEIDAYIKALLITVFLCIACITIAIPIINKKQL